MGLFKKNQTVENAQAATAEDIDEATYDDTAHAINALQAEIDSDPAAKAAQELEVFRMTPGAKGLLDRALENLSGNTGEGLEDPDARLAAKMRASLVSAAGNRLPIVIAALVGSCEKPTDIAPALYSLFNSVVKAAGFIANLDYRRWLDPRAEFDMAMYLDRREDDPSAPPGLDTDVDQQHAWFKETYGAGVEDDGDVILASLADLRLFLQLTLESYGGDPDRVIPFAWVQAPDGKFEELHDVQVAVDHYEIKRVESRKRRNARDADRMASAVQRAQALLTKALG